MAMDWPSLLCSEHLRRATPPKPFELSEFKEDQDAICFSQPFRRLQAKTQVHPLPDNDHVRTRLLHTIEVALIGQALGSMIGAEILKRHPLPINNDAFAEVVKAACLGHDIGHPPFGHAGDYAIRDWFIHKLPEVLKKRLSDAQLKDLEQWEGNAQTFRILTQIENARENGGLQLTYATLGAGMKYPWGVDAVRNTKRKFGYFQSEATYAAEIADKLGLLPDKDGGWCRHPLAYVVEAADDICYSIIDLEDGIVMGSFDFRQFEELLKPFLKGDVDYATEYVDVAKTEWQKISYLRSKAIGGLAKQCVQEFLDKEEKLLAGDYTGSLLDHVPGGEVVKTAKKLGLELVFEHEKKQYAEIASFEIIDGLLTEFTASYLDVKKDPAKASLKSRRMHRLMGEMRPIPEMEAYPALMRIADFISGRTDRYALGMYRQVKGIALSGFTPAPFRS